MAKALNVFTDFAILIGCLIGAHIAIFNEDNFAKAAFWIALATLCRTEMHFNRLRK